MKTNSRFLLAASLVLAMALTFGCSNDSNNNSGNGNSGGFNATNLCGSVSYDPSIYRCEMGELIGKCRGKDYYVAYEQCVNGVVVNVVKSSSSFGMVSSSSNATQHRTVRPTFGQVAISCTLIGL